MKHAKVLHRLVNCYIVVFLARSRIDRTVFNVALCEDDSFETVWCLAQLHMRSVAMYSLW